jgi:hypothetical protein
MRAYEIYVAQAIAEYIRTRSPAGDVSILSGADPPDFLVSVEGTTFPLEVTSTEVWQKPSVGQGQVRELTYQASHKELLRGAEREAIRANVLHGRYAIAFGKPLSAENFAHRRMEFTSCLLHFLDRTKDEPQGVEFDIEIEGSIVAWGYKLAFEGKRLYEVFEDGAWTESPEFVSLVAVILRKALQVKHQKLNEAARASDAILAILNTYALADRQTLLEAAKLIDTDLAIFHSVFVLSDGWVLPLHSREPKWEFSDV